MSKKILAFILTMCMVFSLMTMPTLAAFDDTEGHWGQASIDRWAGYGALKGDDKGSFNPDNNMSRAEFAQFLVNLMGYSTKAASGTFGDIKGDEWYADAILKVAAAGVMKGDGVNANPNAQISRQEAAVLLCRAFGIPESSKALGFTDAGDVADWAKGAVAALAERGMMNGVGGNAAAPLANINRASVAQLADNMIAEYVTSDKTITGKVDGIVLVAGDAKVTVEDAELSAPLVVAPSAEGAAVELTGETKADNVIVQGAAEVKVGEKAAVAAVAVEADKAKVEVAGTADSVKVAAGADVAVNGEVGKVTVAEDAKDVTVKVGSKAKVETVEVAAESTKIEVSGEVGEVKVADTAAGTGIVANTGAKISNVTTSADKVSVTGEGKVENVKVEGEGSAEIKTPGTTIENNGKGEVTDSKGNTVAEGGSTTNPENSGTPGGPGTPAAVTLTVTAYDSGDSTIFEATEGKDYKTSEIQSGLTFAAEGKTITVSGTSTNITEAWTAFSSVESQKTGHYVALKITASDSNAIIKTTSPTEDNLEKTATGVMYLVTRLENYVDSTAKTCKTTVSVGDNTYTIDLTPLAAASGVAGVEAATPAASYPVIAAPLATAAEPGKTGGQADEATYKAEPGSVTEGTGTVTIPVTVTVNNLKKHASDGAGDGYWAGIGIKMPEGESKDSAIFYAGWTAPASTFNTKPDNSLTVTENGESTTYATFYFNIETNRKGYVAYNDGTNTIIYEITFTATLAETFTTLDLSDTLNTKLSDLKTAFYNKGGEKQTYNVTFTNGTPSITGGTASFDATKLYVSTTCDASVKSITKIAIGDFEIWQHGSTSGASGPAFSIGYGSAINAELWNLSEGKLNIFLPVIAMEKPTDGKLVFNITYKDASNADKSATLTVKVPAMNDSLTVEGATDVVNTTGATVAFASNKVTINTTAVASNTDSLMIGFTMKENGADPANDVVYLTKKKYHDGFTSFSYGLTGPDDGKLCYYPYIGADNQMYYVIATADRYGPVTVDTQVTIAIADGGAGA